MPDLETASPVSLQADERRYGEIESGGLVYRTLTLRAPLSAQSGGGFAAVEVAVDTGEDFATLTRRAWMAGLFAAVALVLGTLAAWYVVRTQLMPLRRLASAAAGVEQSTLNRRVSLQGLPSELEEFGGQFNHMLERLEIAYGALRRYADDVAHELRTPINRIQLGAEVALREAGDVEVYREALESTLEECMHLGSMVKSLLFLARVENGQARLMPVTLNVAERLEKVRAFFEENAADGNIAFSVVCEASLSIMADPTLFQRALSNVVANAFAHTPRGGRISIRAAVDGPGVVVEVADSGEGIAPEHQGRIFDRFYRADGARVAVSGRVGLGLAITKSIVDLHQGRVWLESRVGSGTRVFLFFPFRQDVAGMDPGALS